MKNYRTAAGQMVKFFHAIEPRTKKLSSHSKIEKFLVAGVLPPDLHAAIACIEIEFSVEMTAPQDDPKALDNPAECLKKTVLEFCLIFLKEKKPKKTSLRKSLRLIAEIYREYIIAGPDVGKN